jgi:hypothetical protein
MKCAEVRHISAHAIINRKCGGATCSPAGLQTLIHSHAETRLVAVQADIDAAFHLFGNGHFEPPARVHSNPKQLTWFLLGVQGSEPGGTGRADNGFFRWPTRSEKPT